MINAAKTSPDCFVNKWKIVLIHNNSNQLVTLYELSTEFFSATLANLTPEKKDLKACTSVKVKLATLVERA